MQTFAHIQNGVVREVLVLADGLVLGVDLYTPEIADECVPCDPDVAPGMLYDVEAGSFSPAPEPKPPVPGAVSRAQAKIQLLRTPGSTKTLLDDVKAAVEAAGGEVEIWFTDATTWERANPYVAQLGGALKLTDEQIDELFVAAAKIAA